MSAENMRALLRTCVSKTYFVFNNKLYLQVDGLAIGASSSGPAAELFMERLESRAIRSFIEPPKLWLRYVDDTFAKLKKIFVSAFLEHLNKQHPRLKFTTEMQENEKISFLEALVHVLSDRTTKISIYRKATHTDQYLNFDSNHHVKQKIGIISTFKHRIETLISTEEDKKTELNHVKKALKRCGHPNWSLNRKTNNKNKIKEKVEKRGRVVLPYVKGVSEKLGRIFKKYDLETIHKPSAKLRHILCNKMKDKVELLDQTGAVYYNNCKKHPDPKNDYVGETERVLRSRQYEHRTIDHKTAKRSASLHIEPNEEVEKEPQGARRSERIKRKTRRDYKAESEGSNQLLTEGGTEFSRHVASDVHSKSDLEFTILCKDENWFGRGVKEAIAIRKLNPTLNLDEGRYNLSPMYSKLIRTSLEMKTPSHGAKVATNQTNRAEEGGRQFSE